MSPRGGKSEQRRGVVTREIPAPSRGHKPCRQCGQEYPLEYYMRNCRDRGRRVNLCWNCMGRTAPEFTATMAAKRKGVTDEEWRIVTKAADAAEAYREWFFNNSGRFRGKDHHNEYEGETAEDVVNREANCELCREEPPARCRCWIRKAHLMELAIHLAIERGVDFTVSGRTQVA